jgi:hypothetical protein
MRLDISQLIYQHRHRGKNYWICGSFPISDRPLEKTIREVVDSQLYYGIDLITDDELRSNMISVF